MLHDHNVDTAGLQIKENEKTFFWSGRYHKDMNSRDTLETQLNVLETFDPIVPKQFSDSDFLMLGNLVPSVQKRVLDQMALKQRVFLLRPFIPIVFFKHRPFASLNRQQITPIIFKIV